MALKKYGNNKFLIPLWKHWERILCLAYSSIDNSLSPILVFVNTMLWKFDTSKRNENDKNTNFMTKNNSKNSKKYVDIWSSIICCGSELFGIFWWKHFYSYLLIEHKRQFQLNWVMVIKTNKSNDIHLWAGFNKLIIWIWSFLKLLCPSTCIVQRQNFILFYSYKHASTCVCCQQND